MAHWLPAILSFLLPLGATALGVRLILPWLRGRVLDHPNARSSHTQPTPRGGGIVVVAVLIVALWAIALGNNAPLRHVAIITMELGALALVSWIDDRRGAPVWLRLAVQLAAVSAGLANIGLAAFAERNGISPWLLAIPLGLAWMWFVNLYNFMDGIDGIAGGVALSAALGWMFLATRANQDFVFWVALAVAAGSLGFLFHNWSPAKIFMGDAGSTFLGYTFAVLPLLSASEGGDALMLGTLLMWTFIMDAGVTFIRRALKRENVFAAHRTHVYQRLIIGGYKHAQVSALYILLTLLAAALAYAWSWGQPYAPPLIIFGLPLLWLILSRYVRNLNPK